VSNCGFVEWNSVLAKLIEKGLAESGGFNEQCSLAISWLVHEHGNVDDVLVHQQTSSVTLRVEGQAASADSLRLLADQFRRLTADRDPKPP
jgi:hypothetical protein